jgi:CubicO group peptidase (beta-lactamase class C family)
MRLARRFLGGLLLLAACLPAWPHSFPARQWQDETDLRAAGWSPEQLDAAAAYTRDRLKSDAWMLVHRGRVIRRYGDVTRVSNIASARKSVLSILLGMQVDQGVIARDATLAQLGIDDKLGLTATEKSATVRQLMQGRSGIYHPAAYEAPSMKVGRPARGAFAPGANFNYNNWDFNALGTIYRQAVGRGVLEALRTDLAEPLQLEDYAEPTAGHYATESMSVHPAYVMRLSVRDMARIGLLMARDGNWGGRQLVSPEWVRESTTSYSAIRPGVGYGYMWWLGFSEPLASRLRFPGRVFMAAGNLGQYIVVDPVRDIVFVHKVDFEREPGREVSSQEFGELLARVMAAYRAP